MLNDGSLINNLKWFRRKICFCADIRKKRDSAQCDTAPSRTPRSITLRRVQLRVAPSHVFREYLRENEFFSETILDCLSGTQMDWINEEKKCQKIS